MLLFSYDKYKDVTVSKSTPQNLEPEEQADALTEEILMLCVMDGMKAKEQVKQLLMQFVTSEKAKAH